MYSMSISIENLKKNRLFKGSIKLGGIAEKSAVVIIVLSLFLPWICFPLAKDQNSFQTSSQIYISYGYILLALLVPYIIGFRIFLSLVILVIFYFPFMLAGNYLFVAGQMDELNQVTNLIEFAKTNMFEPNIIYFKSNIDPREFTVHWESLFSKLNLVIHNLGFGYFLSFFCALFFILRLKKIEFLYIVVFFFLLLIPILTTDYYLKEAKEAMLEGDFSNSVDYLNKAEKSNKIFWNEGISNTEFFNLMLGESLQRGGYNKTPVSNFYLAGKKEQIGSYQEALNLYRYSDGVIPSNRAIARTLVKDSIVNIDMNRFGTSYSSLKSSHLLNPHRLETIFYLQYLESLLNDHEKSIIYGEILLDKLGNGVLLADVYNMLAKSYSEIGQLQASKDMYKKSLYNYDSLRKGNYPAWKGLAGW